MVFDSNEILSILDQCRDSFTFPMLNNGYIYLASTRLSLYRSRTDWAMVIEVFGFSPRAGLPDTCIHTFASRLYNRDPVEGYVTREAYDRYLATNPHNDSRYVFPVREGPWQDNKNAELVAQSALEVVVRDQSVPLPSVEKYQQCGIELEQSPRVQVFEMCRFLVDVAREQVLATPQERRVSIMPEMEQILQLEEWHHPNVADDERPSGSETFRQLAEVLANNDLNLYRPTQLPNTHWRHWPEGGRL